MENMTKEQAISKLWEDLSAIRDKYFLEEYHPSYWKTKEGFEHESQVIGDVLDFLNEQPASGSVAAPKEPDNLQWPSKSELPNHSEKIEAELAAAKESIKDLLPLAQEVFDSITIDDGESHKEYVSLKSLLSRAKALLDKQ